MDFVSYSSTFFLFTLFVLSWESELTDNLDLVFKNTYIVYGPGRRSERDLPVCHDKYEACNVVHNRLWLLPIAERLCRCPRRTECPLEYDEARSSNTQQHISNRGQLKFCEGLEWSMEECGDDPALRAVVKKSKTSKGKLTRTNLLCRCPWPNHFVLNETTRSEEGSEIFTHTCNELPKCSTGETCGHIRADTFEIYYTCSCPTNHLCVFEEPFRYSTHEAGQLRLPHFKGESYRAICTKK